MRFRDALVLLVALASPEELRRVALGGEVVEVQTAQPFDGSLLRHVSGVRDIKQSSARNLLVVAEDAGEVIPRLIHEVGAAGGEVTSSSEYRPTFDEVFARLIERDDNSDSTTSDKDARLEPVARAA